MVLKSSPARVKRGPRECIGEIWPDAMYSLDRVMELIGIGYEQIAQGVRDGIIKKYPAGIRIYIEGRDVIAWIKSQGAK